MTLGAVTGYIYDAEGRIVSLNNGATTYTYDAEGRRVAKGGASAANYLLGLGGEQVTELTPSGGWAHSNVWAGGKLIGTYEGPNGTDTAGYHFPLTDWLGTKRMGTYSTGLPEESPLNGPIAPKAKGRAEALPLSQAESEDHKSFRRRQIVKLLS